MKLKKFFKVVAVSFCIFLPIDSVTYVLLAHKAVPHMMVRYLPESSDSFCCVSKQTWNGLSEQQQQALDEELHKRFQTLYHGEDQIPESQKRYSAPREKLSESDSDYPPGFEGGFIFKWKAKNRMPLIISAESSEYCGSLCAEGRTAIFAWVLYKWVHIFTYNQWIS